MGLFNSAGKNASKNTSLVLVDIDSSSVGGALLHTEKGVRTLYYSAREYIEKKEGEEASEAMLRTLTAVIDLLVTKGAPILHKETGSGHIDRILVSIGAPWQKTTVRIEAIVDTKPFVFTQALLSEITKKNRDIPAGFIKSSESVVATLLNGYETPRPFGKKVTRVDMVVLASFIEASISEAVETALRRAYHTHALTLIAFSSVAYSVFRDIYPHEKDFLVVEASAEATDLAFVKRGLLAEVVTVEQGTRALAQDSREWLTQIKSVLENSAAKHTLPSTLFVVSSDESREELKNLLESQSLRALWLSDEPTRVISVLPGHFAQFVKIRGEANPDLYLMLLALFAA